MNFYTLPVFAESWNVAYRKKKCNAPLAHSDEPFTVINNSFRFWAADPFLFEKGEDIFIFAELYDYIRCKGVIGYYQLNAKRPHWIPVIQEEHHLSFPFIFEIDNEIYILPEANKSNSLYCYHAVEFPNQWERMAPFYTNVRLADTTIIPSCGHDFALSYDLSDESLKLLNLSDKTIKVLFWDKQGIRRPAGYISEETAIRVAQDCEHDYGEGLILYQYSFSEESGYQETEIKRVYPQEVILSKKLYLTGMHTYNQSRVYEVIDVKTRRFNILNFCVRMIRAVKRKLRSII